VKFRVLVIVCAAVVALSCLGFALLPAPASWHLGWFATLFSYTAAVAGAAIGASSFGRGDRLRWAWLLVASYAVIGLGKVILWGPPRHVGPALGLWPHSLTPLTGAISTIGLNVCSVAGLTLFARVWHGTGLTPPWRGRITLAAFALGVVVGGLPVLRDIQMIAGGQTIRIAGLASSLGDIAAITLVGPILVTAIAMRGGLLVWPWTILTASSIAWLMFDAVQLLPAGLVPASDVGTVVAATLTTGAGGLAHHWVVRTRT